ncbi:hypothetical protein BU23DRAFT_484058, partial [Bimuria novae-zelandiae CBS 107.79]
IDRRHRDWRWQLQSCTRFCDVHFARSIKRAVPSSEHVEDSVWGRMRALLRCKTSEEYYSLLNLLIENEPEVKARNWARHKKNLVIAAGLVFCCSNIKDRDVWNTLASNSNVAEQAGQKGYRTGKHVPLLGAIFK